MGFFRRINWFKNGRGVTLIDCQTRPELSMSLNTDPVFPGKNNKTVHKNKWGLFRSTETKLIPTQHPTRLFRICLHLKSFSSFIELGEIEASWLKPADKKNINISGRRRSDVSADSNDGDWACVVKNCGSFGGPEEPTSRAFSVNCSRPLS